MYLHNYEVIEAFGDLFAQMSVLTAAIAITVVHALTSRRPVSQGDNASVMLAGTARPVDKVRYSVDHALLLTLYIII